jgi:hypothetical protein
MIIILKIILFLFATLDVYVMKFLYQDFKQTEKTLDYEESRVVDKVKMKLLLYFTLIALFSFFAFMVYYIIIPMQIN